MDDEQLNEWAALQSQDKAALYATVSHVQRLEDENRRLREALEAAQRDIRWFKNLPLMGLKTALKDKP